MHFYVIPAAELILSYLNEKNRPYSAQDVFGNLQKQHGLGKTVGKKGHRLSQGCLILDSDWSGGVE